MLQRACILFAAAALAAGASAAQAATFSAEYVFGDSLSDNGNLAEGYYNQNLPNPPSYSDTFSNGPSAVQALANSYGLALRPSLWVTGFSDPYNLFGGASFVPGTNYAVADASAQAAPIGGIPNINLPQQVTAFSAATAGHADPGALYTIFIGGNDVRNAALYGTGSSAIVTAVSTEVLAIETLAAEGAKNFLIVNVPDVGNTPAFAQADPTLAPTATQLTQQYNLLLSTALAGLALPGTDVTQFDLYNYNANILAHASAYGLTDTTDPCYTNTPLSSTSTSQCGAAGANVSSFAYWDALHPTGTVQALWAEGFESALNPAPTPEPSSLLLLGSGLASAFVLRRRR